MHVTILHLSTEPKAPPYSDDEVFGDNQDKFPDGVEKRTGADHREDVKTFLDYLGDAVKTGKTKGVTWIDIDREKAIDLFQKPFEDFLAHVSGLHNHDIRDFATGGHGLGDDIRRLNEAYDFDSFYICCDCLCAQPVSDWLRCIIGSASVQTRYYLHETYDGDQ